MTFGSLNFLGCATDIVCKHIIIIHNHTQDKIIHTNIQQGLTAHSHHTAEMSESLHTYIEGMVSYQVSGFE